MGDKEETRRNIEWLEARIEEDIAELENIMSRLGIERSVLKDTMAALTERFGLLKANGHLVKRSPLSELLEVEGLIAAVNSKKQLWLTLRSAAESGQAELDRARMSELHGSAAAQGEMLEAWHQAAAGRVLETSSPATA